MASWCVKPLMANARGVRIFGWVFGALCLAGSAVIAVSSRQYFGADDDLPEFVLEHFPLRHAELWLLALKVHVVAAAFALPACVVLLTKGLQRRPRVHRWLGRVTGAVTLFALVPSGLVLSEQAKGGLVVTAGFVLSALLIAWFMGQGIVSARRRDFVTHRRAVWHVVAQMSVAVSSRAMLIGFDALGVDPKLAYVIALWVPVAASAVAVELLSGRLRGLPAPRPAKLSEAPSIAG